MSVQAVQASFTLRDEDGEPIQLLPDELSQAATLKSKPWRTFRWYLGQRHYSGSYWSATESQHVIYESRLELSRLLMADFDPCVKAIRAQPFLMRALVGEKVRRHIPDYLFVMESGPVTSRDVVYRQVGPVGVS